MSDRIGVMRGGKMVQVSKPEDLFNLPKNDFIGEFIGQPRMNFLDGVLDSDGSVELASEANKLLRLDAEMVGEFETPRDVIIGIRPQHLTISERDEDGFMSAKYDVDELIGTEHVTYLIDDSDNELRVLVSDRPRIERGERVSLTKPTRLYAFDADSGDLLSEFDDSEYEVAPAQTS